MHTCLYIRSVKILPKDTFRNKIMENYLVISGKGNLSPWSGEQITVKSRLWLQVDRTLYQSKSVIGGK